MKRAALLLPALVLLAGCFSGGHPSAVAPVSSIDEGGNIIQGWVLDDDSVPVPDVLILLQPGGQNATSDVEGRFELRGVFAGNHLVVASKLGFLDAKEEVFVSGGPVELNLTLVHVATQASYERVLGPFSGYFQCRWSTAAVNGHCGVVRQCAFGQCADTTPAGDALWANDQDAYALHLESDAWKTMVFDVRWTPGLAATSPRMALFLSYEGGPSDHLFTRSQPSTSPLHHIYQNAPNQNGVFPTDTPRLPRLEDNVLAWMSLHTDGNCCSVEQTQVALAYEVHFELFATVFYGQPAPEGYTAFAEA